MFMVSKVSFLLILSLPSVASSASNLLFKTSNPTKKTKNFFDLQKILSQTSNPTHFKSLQNLQSLIDSSLVIFDQNWSFMTEIGSIRRSDRIQVRELLIRINFPGHLSLDIPENTCMQIDKRRQFHDVPWKIYFPI